MPRTKPVVDVVAEMADVLGDRVNEAASPNALATLDKPIATVAETAHLPSRPSKRSSSKLPAPLQFPLVAILSFSISSLGYSFLTEFTKGEMSSYSRTFENQNELAIMTVWRLFELALGWFAEFDSFDLAALNLLSHSPSFFLMTAFYGISPSTAIAGLSIDVAASFLPFLMLRSLSSAHKATESVPNREIITDRSIQAMTSVFAGVIYNVTLFLACHTYLPGALVLYFEGIPTIEPAANANNLLVSPLAAGLALASGLAARTFIFTPVAGTGKTAEDDKLAQFDAVEASLGQTIWWNIWGYTSQSKVGIVRTAVLMLVTGINTYLQLVMTVNGIEGTGAAIYASVWVLAAFFTGLGLGLVGEV